MDDDSLNPTFGYVDDDGRKHAVWFLDAADPVQPDQGRRRLPAAWAMRCGGWAARTRRVWKLLAPRLRPGQRRGPGDPARPARTSTSTAPARCCTSSDTPKPGRRTLSIDPDTGLISGETYDVHADLLRDRSATAPIPGWVALTFDDGPDGRWTPKILDILKAKHAPATFFVIGENMQSQPGPGGARGARGPRWSATTPGPIRTSARSRPAQTDGRAERHPAAVRDHHRPLDAPVPAALSSATPSPRRPREVAPLLVGPEAGLPDRRPAHRPGRLEEARPRADRRHAPWTRLADTGDRPGQVVLLHDSGGDRSRTVEALPVLIDALRAHGYRLVTVGRAGRHDAGRRRCRPTTATPARAAARPGRLRLLPRRRRSLLQHPVHHRHRAGRRAAAVPGRPGAGPPLHDRAAARRRCSTRRPGR